MGVGHRTKLAYQRMMPFVDYCHDRAQATPEPAPRRAESHIRRLCFVWGMTEHYHGDQTGVVFDASAWTHFFFGPRADRLRLLHEGPMYTSAHSLAILARELHASVRDVGGALLQVCTWSQVHATSVAPLGTEPKLRPEDEQTRAFEPAGASSTKVVSVIEGEIRKLELSDRSASDQPYADRDPSAEPGVVMDTNAWMAYLDEDRQAVLDAVAGRRVLTHVATLVELAARLPADDAEFNAAFERIALSTYFENFDPLTYGCPAGCGHRSGIDAFVLATASVHRMGLITVKRGRVKEMYKSRGPAGAQRAHE